MAGVAGVVALSTAPGLVDEVQVFRCARPCAVPVSPSAACLRTYPATVRGTVIENEGRSQLYLLKLDGPPRSPQNSTWATRTRC